MKKLLLSISILFFTLTNLNAQKTRMDIGFLGGLNTSNFYGSKFTLKKAKLKSYAIGSYFGYTLNDIFSFRANLMYEVKGEETNIQPTDPLGNSLTGNTNLELNYITLILLTRGSFGDNVKFFAEVGPCIGYLINATAKTVTQGVVGGINYGTIREDIKPAYKSTNFGLTAGIGATYPINKKLGIEIAIRRSIGLTSISKINSAPATYFSDNLKTNSFSVLAGMSFKL